MIKIFLITLILAYGLVFSVNAKVEKKQKVTTDTKKIKEKTTDTK
jgi:hypothetical protein